MNIIQAIGNGINTWRTERTMKRMDSMVVHRINDISRQRTMVDAKGETGPSHSKLANPKNLSMNRRLISFNGIYANTWNMLDMYHAYTAEGYLKYTIDSYTDSAMRNGYVLKSKNDVVTKYLTKRFKEFELMSGITNLELFRSMFFSLLLYGNIFLAKFRSEDQSSGKVYNRMDGKTMKPIAAIYPEDCRRIRIEKAPNDRNFSYVRMPYFGRGLRPLNTWNLGNSYFERDIPYGSNSGTFNLLRMYGRAFSSFNGDEQVTIKEHDMLHIRYHAAVGEKWAMPPFHPALQDIEALRLVEESIELLMFQYGHPLYHIAIGTDKLKGTQDEINDTVAKLQSMESNGFLITDNRQVVKVIGAEGAALRAEAYLQYFKQRLFTELWLSTVTTGQDGAPRATADIIDKVKQDKTIEIQAIIGAEMQKLLIELLQEGGAPLDWILKEENIPSIEFYEVDLDNKIKQENHYLNQFSQGAITRTELRADLGKKPLADGEEDDTFPMIQSRAKEAEIQAKMQASANSSKAAIQSSNQHGKKTGPSTTRNS